MEFGLPMPAVYTLMYGEAREKEPPAALAALDLPRRKVHRVGAAGRLRTSAERATRLMHADGVGVVLSLIATPSPERDPDLSVIVREQLLRTVTTGGDGVPATPSGVHARAAALREALRTEGTPALTPAEGSLLAEWLDRMADAGDDGPHPGQARPPGTP